MATMTTKRCYWVDWICTFDKTPTKAELSSKKLRIEKYLKQYLKMLNTKPSKKGTGVSGTVFGEELLEWKEKDLMWVPVPPSAKASGSVMLGAKNNWINMLRWEWDQLSFRPLVFNFKAYFEGSGIRFTPDVRGSMTPPPPPPPPGNP